MAGKLVFGVQLADSALLLLIERAASFPGPQPKMGGS